LSWAKIFAVKLLRGEIIRIQKAFHGKNAAVNPSVDADNLLKTFVGKEIFDKIFNYPKYNDQYT